jgi:hypothetical protein
MVRRRDFLAIVALGSVALRLPRRAAASAPPPPLKSKRSGRWSSPGTWDGGRLPGAGDYVEIQPGHVVVYDVSSDRAIRMVHILGRLTFARDRDTRLDVGLIKVGGDASENGAALTSHAHAGVRPALVVGTVDAPIPAGRTALIRLAYFAGADRDSLPAIVCCGGQMDFHGAPLRRTFVKLGAPVRKGDSEIALAEDAGDWRVGDRILLTGTTRQIPSDDSFRETTRDNTQTEEHIIAANHGDRLAIERPAAFDHVCAGAYRGDVANLSRNVVVESADPDGERGHTMYHYGSSGGISYAEFRRLGKRGVLGRYTVHFHRLRDSMRGTSVVGASIWDSHNRWITVHGTDYLVVRDCVGYNSVGHGYFLEDGTEVFNVFDRNLAVQGRTGDVLPGQVLPFDHNSGSGFWWANSLNTFTRNVACECDVYGFRFDAQKTADFDPELSVPQSDGSMRRVDIRTLPFVRFEDNESHCQRNHAMNIGGLDIQLGGGCGGVGPDEAHPLVLRNTRVWNSHWGFHPFSPSLLVDGYDIHDSAYGLWKPDFHRHAYRGVRMDKISNHIVLDARGPLPPALAARDIGPAERFVIDELQPGFPAPLTPRDTLPPVVIVTYIGTTAGRTVVRGTASDCGPITRIQVNGQATRAARPEFAEWEITLEDAARDLAIRAEDAAGNISTHTVSGLARGH